MEELSTWLATTLPDRAGAGANAAEVADTLVALLQDVDAALALVIGQPSVTLIYQRSLVLNAPAHPWMTGAHEQADIDFGALRSVFAQQSSGDAAIGGSAFLQTFYGLLVDMVGVSLTERLLRPIWANYARPSA